MSGRRFKSKLLSQPSRLRKRIRDRRIRRPENLEGFGAEVHSAVFLATAGNHPSPWASGRPDLRWIAAAKDIGDAIRSDPALAGATGISLPAQVPRGYYRGLTLPVYDSGASVFDHPFAQVPIITFVTGLELTPTATASCPPSEQPGQVRVRRDGADIVVCF